MAVDDGQSAGVPGVDFDVGDDGNGGDVAGFFDFVSKELSAAKDSVFSGAASISASLTGVTREDVKSGAVDPNTLSREQQAQLAIDGATGGPIPNPWHVLADLVSTDVAQLGAGGVLVFDVETNAALALLDDLAPPGFALLWDDQVFETRGAIPTATFGTSTLLAEVGPKRGTRLTLWGDSTLSCSLRKIGPPGSLERLKAEEKAAKREDSNPISAAIDKFLNVQLGVGLAVVAVVGVALVLFIRSGQVPATVGALKLGAAV